MEKTNRELINQNIYILANKYNNNNINIINKLIDKIKNLIIVSSNYKNYINLEEKIFIQKRRIDYNIK